MSKDVAKMLQNSRQSQHEPKEASADLIDREEYTTVGDNDN